MKPFKNEIVLTFKLRTRYIPDEFSLALKKHCENGTVIPSIQDKRTATFDGVMIRDLIEVTLEFGSFASLLDLINDFEVRMHLLTIDNNFF